MIIIIPQGKRIKISIDFQRLPLLWRKKGILQILVIDFINMGITFQMPKSREYSQVCNSPLEKCICLRILYSLRTKIEVARQQIGSAILKSRSTKKLQYSKIAVLKNLSTQKPQNSKIRMFEIFATFALPLFNFMRKR